VQEGLHPGSVSAGIFFWGKSSVGQVAAPASGHEQLLANFGIMVKESDVRTALGGSEGSKNPGGAGANNPDIHSKIIPVQASAFWHE
jgi:hypothetical protein